MFNRRPSGVAGLCITAIAALAVAGTASAQTPAPAPLATIGIKNCHVQRSHRTHAVWFYCAVTADGPENASVDYRSNLATYKPPTGGTWSNQTGTLRFTGGGRQIGGLKFAVRNRSLTPAQVRAKLRVTLSNAQGATITNAVATAAR